jgi:Ca2+-binding EF-hand superfamily protein
MAHKKLSFLVSVAALNGVTEAEKYKEIDQIFAYFDLDQDSEVTFSELGAGFSSFDKDEDGLISETELLKLPAARLKSLCTDTRFKRYFNRQNNV